MARVPRPGRAPLLPLLVAGNARPAPRAGACPFLASPLASYVSGATLEAHGGGEPPAFRAAVAEPARASDPPPDASS